VITPHPITIIGGGLAGLSLGIKLRQAGVAVHLHEAGLYPRHRVCGEFISGTGVKILSELLSLPDLQKMSRLTSSVLLIQGKSALPWSCPEKAISISRFELDARLSQEFVRLGGNLLVNSRWRGDETTPGLVKASGRRIEMQDEGWRWIGLKAHAEGIELHADLEMHFFENAYIGLCQLLSGKVNVCGLWRTRLPILKLHESWPALLQGDAGSPLQSRFKRAAFVPETFCSVAGLAPTPHSPNPEDPCSVGDAMTMVPPVTGNGMSVAFESSSLAVPSLVSYSKGEIDWPTAKDQIIENSHRHFAKRFSRDALLHRLVMDATLRNLALGALKIWPGFLDLIFRRTR
jgi:flavin-dependent dehydrogenase